MNRNVNTVSGRLSLRQPQRDSLEILARVVELFNPQKDLDLKMVLEVIRSEFASVEDFERGFVSLCFHLATGVGKTRLMGAFIAYLYLEKGIKNFFVLAPNLTIYNKLIEDFTAGSKKYVFAGISEFVINVPTIITGDNYENARAEGLFSEVQINVFNISKLNKDSSEKKGVPRIKRLSEYIGESYFAYLSNLPDLVLLMDESHRYRGDAGIKVIEELKPVLGLELTATPFVEAAKGKQIPFKNVIYSYPLSYALRDGFVKEPAVATRENFKKENYSSAELEEIKLSDAIRLHELTKLELEIYARESGKPRVKPFVMVIAKDTDHARSIEANIKTPEFFDGRYADRVIRVDSSQTGSERDENILRLVSVESADESTEAGRTEIVIHVNMLKEGWDVTNLYTIVPLRAADSRTLVEQAIGRGLRLPYGRRVGSNPDSVHAADRLTIVAHDNFEEIVREAKDPKSQIKLGQIFLPENGILERVRPVTVPPSFLEALVPSQYMATGLDTDHAASLTAPLNAVQSAPVATFTLEQQPIAAATLNAIEEFQNLPRLKDLNKPEIRQQITEHVSSSLALDSGLFQEPEVVNAVVQATIQAFTEQMIAIPRILVLPTGNVSSGYNDFDLEVSTVRLQPVDSRILLEHLSTNQRERIDTNGNVRKEPRLENYILRGLVDFDEIDYDDHAELINKLATQLVRHLESYLPDRAAVENVLMYNQKHLCSLVKTQLNLHVWESQVDFEAKISKGFTTFKASQYTTPVGETIKDFRLSVPNKLDIPKMLFGGFKRALYRVQKFSSDSERLFAVLLENETDTSLKWFKPASGQFRIYYDKNTPYEPDFVVETATKKYICEPKRASEMNDPVVQRKAEAAAIWCRNATRHATQHGDKPWVYLLIPHDAIDAVATLQGLEATYARA